MRTLLLVLCLAACSKSSDGKHKHVGTVGADGVRRVPVEVGTTGYDPATIWADAGEKLVLVFHRTVEGDCLSQVKVADGPLVDLPMDKTVEVPVTVPQTGKVTFVCGMDMQKGEIAVD